ncbi:MAG: EamA family transporter [Armatimonadetes bacterium]|nr:EamA family transporter [Armatimonadota bacterium]
MDQRTVKICQSKVKVLAVMSIATTLAAFGDVSLSKGMKQVGAAAERQTFIDTFSFALANPYVLAGVGLLIAFLCLYLASLSWEDLSFVLPLAAADYVLVTLLAFVLLGEDVSPLRWVGSLLVAAGVMLVART